VEVCAHALALTRKKRLNFFLIFLKICEHAVALTRENAELFHLDRRLQVHHDGVTPWAAARAASLMPPHSLPLEEGSQGGQVGERGEGVGGGGLRGFDLLVSNPPYIPAAQLLGLDAEVRDFEDHVALDGGEDGASNLI
jgi:methylase of polypeptide subunit release factors